MPTTSIAKSALLMFIIVIAAVTAREVYLRYKGAPLAYDDGAPFWSYKRGLIYQPKYKSTVFIGTSRMSYDLDIETWKDITGDEPVQLAIVATSPMSVLVNLADDKNFKGRIIVDAMEEGLFLGDNATPLQYISYYNNITPAQKASFQINWLLESKFVFLDKDNFSLGAALSKIKLASREGVWMPPVFPMEFTWTNGNRQHFMTNKFAADTSLQNQVRKIWNQHHNFFKDTIKIEDQAKDSILQLIKTATAKIKSRGGEIIFVKLPSSGPYLMSESRDFPREKYWDILLKTTACPGIHCMDYPDINHFQCPEWSHLSQTDAVIFTRGLIKILQEEKKWSFPKSTIH